MSVHLETDIPDNESLADSSQYMADVSTQLVSSVLGLMGFMTALVVGLMAGNPGLVILMRALVAMFVCAIVGRLLGAAGEVCVWEFAAKYKSDRPQPVKPRELVDLDREQRVHESVVDSMKKAA